MYQQLFTPQKPLNLRPKKNRQAPPVQTTSLPFEDLSVTRYVAMKAGASSRPFGAGRRRSPAAQVQKSAPHYTEAAYDEIELLAEAGFAFFLF